MERVIIALLVSILILTQTGNAFELKDILPDLAATASDLILTHQADNIMDLAGMRNESMGNDSTKFLIGSIITYTYDPLSDQFVIKTKNFTAYLFFYILLIFAFGGAAYIRMQYSLPKLASIVEETFNIDPYTFDFERFMISLCLAALFLALGYWGVDYLMQLDYVSTAAVTAVTLDSIAPITSNPIAYFVMSINVLVLSFFMIWRIYVIGFITAYILVVLVLSLFPALRPYMACVLFYFIVMFFGRVILVAAAGFFVYAAQSSLPSIISYSPGPYIVAGWGLQGIAFLLVFGPFVVMWLCRRSINILKVISV